MSFDVDLKEVQMAHLRMNGYSRDDAIKGYYVYKRPDGGKMQYLGNNKWTVWRDGANEPPVDKIVKELNEWGQVKHS